MVAVFEAVLFGMLVYAGIGFAVMLLTVEGMEDLEKGYRATPRFCIGLTVLWPVVLVIVLVLSVRDVWRWVRSLKRPRKEKDDERGE